MVEGPASVYDKQGMAGFYHRCDPGDIFCYQETHDPGRKGAGSDSGLQYFL